MAPLEVRVKELERIVRTLVRENQALVVRGATPNGIQRGRWFGVLNDTLTQGGTAPFEILHWIDGAWERTGKTLTVRDFYLNDTEVLPSETKGEAVWYRNTWVLGFAYCLASNTLPEEEE